VAEVSLTTSNGDKYSVEWCRVASPAMFCVSLLVWNASAAILKRDVMVDLPKEGVAEATTLGVLVLHGWDIRASRPSSVTHPVDFDYSDAFERHKAAYCRVIDIL
jgi:hypothetical protein